MNKFGRLNLSTTGWSSFLGRVKPGGGQNENIQQMNH